MTRSEIASLDKHLSERHSAQLAVA
jgi:hypothetical protein